MTIATGILEIEHFLMEWAQPKSLRDRRRLAHDLNTLFEKPVRAWIENFVRTWPANQDDRHTAVLTNRLLAIRKNTPYIFHDYRRAIEAAEYMKANIRRVPAEEVNAFSRVLGRKPGDRDVTAAFDPVQPFEDDAHKKDILLFADAGVTRAGFDAPTGRYYLLRVLSHMKPEDAQTPLNHLRGSARTGEADAAAAAVFDNTLMLWAASAVDTSRRKRLGLNHVPLPERYRPEENKIAVAGSNTVNAVLALSFLFGVYVSTAPREVQQAVKTYLTGQNPSPRP